MRQQAINGSALECRLQGCFHFRAKPPWDVHPRSCRTLHHVPGLLYPGIRELQQELKSVHRIWTSFDDAALGRMCPPPVTARKKHRPVTPSSAWRQPGIAESDAAGHRSVQIWHASVRHTTLHRIPTACTNGVRRYVTRPGFEQGSVSRDLKHAHRIQLPIDRKEIQ